MNENKRARTKNFYNIIARLYDPFKNLWNKVFSQKAEQKFSNFLLSNVDKNKTILELGCGTAVNLEKIHELNLSFKSYVGVDLTPNMLEAAKNKFPSDSAIEFLQEDLYDFVNNEIKNNRTYDIILCTWVLSHLEHQGQLINEIQKLLNDNGKLFLIFTTKPKWYVSFWMTPLFKWIFSGNYVPETEIKQFNNVLNFQQFSANMVSVVEIGE
ncbi:class I SAM-dependent DNA methyltransferase [Dethiobacter alkaliphilus]|uniref:Methyltransferase type 12 n=1 Tax=Dethiobacter alkaliphilus AHT 1 TaxID=555088 RepID=C0GFD1_DETAL|nr:class I SAM-dependent methyltransferase [Dethiobacter alkaliphilus]EEG77891.1 Methyltransferase type 12 [Dethiobacter alkaliphilus AHT 1]